MDVLHYLLRFGHATKEHAVPVWKAAVLQFEQGMQWLKARPRVVFWAGRYVHRAGQRSLGGAGRGLAH